MPATWIDTMLCIALIFIALSLGCAVAFAKRGANAGIGRWRDAPADPFASPFGDMPGFTAEQLRLVARGAERNIARDPLRRSFPTIPEPVGNCPPTAGGRRRSIGSLGAGAVRSFLSERA